STNDLKDYSGADTHLGKFQFVGIRMGFNGNNFSDNQPFETPGYRRIRMHGFYLEANGCQHSGNLVRIGFLQKIIREIVAEPVVTDGHEEKYFRGKDSF